MTSSRAFLLSALCALIILSAFIDSTQAAGCCLRNSKTFLKRHRNCDQIRDYYIQTINKSCDLESIIFMTDKGWRCVDPSAPGTLNLMKCVDEKKKTTRPVFKARTTTNSKSS